MQRTVDTRMKHRSRTTCVNRNDTNLVPPNDSTTPSRHRKETYKTHSIMASYDLLQADDIYAVANVNAAIGRLKTLIFMLPGVSLEAFGKILQLPQPFLRRLQVQFLNAYPVESSNGVAENSKPLSPFTFKQIESCMKNMRRRKLPLNPSEVVRHLEITQGCFAFHWAIRMNRRLSVSPSNLKSSERYGKHQYAARQYDDYFFYHYKKHVYDYHGSIVNAVSVNNVCLGYVNRISFTN